MQIKKIYKILDRETQIQSITKKTEFSVCEKLFSNNKVRYT